jgi:cardiolipin synthase
VTLPNIITLVRLLMVPMVVWAIISEAHVTAFVIFVLAGLGDAVDGFIARTFDLRSQLGAYLDPIADKALLVSIYLSLAFSQEIPLWLVLLVVSRDLLIVGAVILAWMIATPIEIRPRIVSKVNTLAQIVLAALVLADLAFAMGLGTAREVMIWVVAMLTGASMAAYFIDWVRHMAPA